MEMPGYLDYQKMAMQDPMAYGQSMDQLSLAKLFQAEKQKQAESKTLADMMANDQTKQMNPLLVESQRLTNTGKDTSNQDAGLTLERNKAMQQNNMSADQRAAALKMSEDQLKAAQQRIELDFMSGDPQRIERAKQGEQMLAAVRAEKRKAAEALDLERYKQTQETGRALERNASNERVANTRAAAKGSSPADFWSTFYGKLKTARDRHAALIAEATKLGADDPEAQKMMAMAEAIRPQVQAEIAQAKPGAINSGAVTGLPVNPAPQVAPRDVAPRASSPVTHKLSEVMSMYPGKSEAEVRAAYKRKFGVDL